MLRLLYLGEMYNYRLCSGAKPNPTNAVPINKIITDKPIINVPGCPPIGEVWQV